MENFFGLIRQSSWGDDRLVRAVHGIATVTTMLNVMHELKIQFHPRGRANVGRPIIGLWDPEYSDDLTERLCRSLIALASLHFDFPDPAKSYTSEELRDISNDWFAMDVHHEKDDAYKADFTNNVAGHGIAAMSQGRRTPSNATDGGPAIPEDQR
jgi:hypothetical protein